MTIRNIVIIVIVIGAVISVGAATGKTDKLKKGSKRGIVEVCLNGSLYYTYWGEQLVPAYKPHESNMPFKCHD